MIKKLPNGQSVPSFALSEFLKYNFSKNDMKLKVLDLGAGLSPYRHILEQHNFEYFSQDFSRYDPKELTTGYQNENWDYPIHTFTGDILATPTKQKYDLVICTEVFEHIPNPVAALEVIFKLLNPGGKAFITVPGISLIHQAPYYFQSGLSQYWFEYWGKEMGFSNTEIEYFGNYMDFMFQEISRLLEPLPKSLARPKDLAIAMPARIATKYLKKFLQKIEGKLTSEIKTSLIMNIVCVLTKS